MKHYVIECLDTHRGANGFFSNCQTIGAFSTDIFYLNIYILVVIYSSVSIHALKFCLFYIHKNQIGDSIICSIFVSLFDELTKRKRQLNFNAAELFWNSERGSSGSQKLNFEFKCRMLNKSNTSIHMSQETVEIKISLATNIIILKKNEFCSNEWMVPLLNMVLK